MDGGLCAAPQPEVDQSAYLLPESDMRPAEAATGPLPGLMLAQAAGVAALSRVQGAMQVEFAASERIPPGYALALARLEGIGRAVTVKQFQAACLMESNASYCLDRLEGQGLIQRAATPGDRRVCEVAISAQGRAWVARLRQALSR